jgi:phosphoglycolate phosphatase-like HAD superfamily hydrolase
MTENSIYALDFDGVICDSAIETGITGWKAATHIWDDMSGQLPAQPLLDAFRRVRPALETGYEAILIMRLLFQAVSDASLLEHYSEQMQSVINNENLDVDVLKALFGETRDLWIENNLQEWITMNPLFPGVAEKLQQLNRDCSWSIITTKQERFVKQILQANQIDLSDQHIYGLDRNLSKPVVLTQLLNKYPDQTICFIEDRLPTLKNVMQHKELASIQLFLADWGYNTAEDRSAVNDSSISLIGIEQFPG